MDKRIEKTTHAIYASFTKLLKEKDYADIIVEDILKDSGVSRSTFYAHFKTKEELLCSVSDHIFSHVFSHSLHEEKSHDFSQSSIFDYRHLVSHIFYHLYDEKELVGAILESSGKDIFLAHLREELTPICTALVKEGALKKKDVGDELYIASVKETFVATMAHWFKHGCGYSPEAIAGKFFLLLE